MVTVASSCTSYAGNDVALPADEAGLVEYIAKNEPGDSIDFCNMETQSNFYAGQPIGFQSSYVSCVRGEVLCLCF